MTAELAQVPDRRARWRFAAGRARTAVYARKVLEQAAQRQRGGTDAGLQPC